jgi:hypothetical protein
MTEFGPLANPRLCVFAEGGSVQYKWQVLFQTVSCGPYCEKVVKTYLEQLNPQSGFKVCPGIREYPKEIRFDTKNVRRWGIPFNRIDALSCVLWHVPNNVHHPAGDQLRDICQPCRVLHYDICKLTEKAQTVTMDQKVARTSVQSNYPLKYLSPSSKEARISKVAKERKNLAAKLSSVVNLDYNLSDKQHAELLQIVRTVNRQGSKAVDELCSRGDQLLGEENNPLRDVWHQDVVERLEYEKNQHTAGAVHQHAYFNMYLYGVLCPQQHPAEPTGGVLLQREWVKFVYYYDYGIH